MREQLTAAIEQRRIVTFTYQGFPRRVQPAAYGIGNRKGKETLHAYQIGGASQRGDIPHWRNFHVEQIESLAVLDEVFGPNPPGFQPQPLPKTYVSLAGAGTGTPPPPGRPGEGGQQGQGGQGGQPDQVIPGIPITSEQAAKAAEQAGKAIAGAADALGKWFRKRK